MKIRHTAFAVYLMAFVTLCDQLSKYWIQDNLLRTRYAIEITPFLNFVLVWNKGVTFGLMNKIGPQAMPWILTAAAILILILLGQWLCRTTSTRVALSLGAIMGGAIGNVIDRIRYGAVIDFIDFYYRDYHWYAFNIADTAIVIGVFFLAMDSLVTGRRTG